MRRPLIVDGLEDIKLEVTKLAEGAIIPFRKFPTDAGADLYSLHSVVIKPNTFKVVRTGIALKVPEGYVGIIKPKSRNNHLVGAGVVDSGYRGEILVKIFNPTNDDLVIRDEEGIAQILLIPCITPKINEVSLDEFNSEITERGKTGGIVGQ